jgi:hypothetical protein
MPSDSFELETYSVLTSHGGGGLTYRALGLVSKPLAHGIRPMATLYYMESPPAHAGWVHNVDQPNFNGQAVYAYSRLTNFADVYDIVRSEKPISVSYFYAGPDFDPSQPVRSLSFIQVYTGLAEPPGEGPKDMSPP